MSLYRSLLGSELKSGFYFVFRRLRHFVLCWFLTKVSSIREIVVGWIYLKYTLVQVEIKGCHLINISFFRRQHWPRVSNNEITSIICDPEWATMRSPALFACGIILLSCCVPKTGEWLSVLSTFIHICLYKPINFIFDSLYRKFSSGSRKAYRWAK